MKRILLASMSALVLLCRPPPVSAQEQLIRAELTLHAPDPTPAPNFSPFGKKVSLTAFVTKAVDRAADKRQTIPAPPPAALVFTENVPDLMRACAQQAKAVLLGVMQAAVDTGTTRPDAELGARGALVNSTQFLADQSRAWLVAQRADLIERARSGNPAAVDDLFMCMLDRRLAQIDGAVSTGLKAGSSKWKGGQR